MRPDAAFPHRIDLWRRSSERQLMWKRLTALLFACLPFSAAAASAWSALSPDGKNEIRLASGDGLCVEVRRNGKVMLAPTRIGMVFERGLTIGGGDAAAQAVERKKIDERIPTPIYKKKEIANRANETLVKFEKGWAVRLHAADDGVAYRFETDFGDGRIKVLGERCDLRFPDAGQRVVVSHDRGAHLNDPLQNSWESPYQDVTAAEICAGANAGRIAYLPFLAAGENGAMGITEADLLDYAGLNFRRENDDRSDELSAVLAKWPVKEKQQRITVFWWVHDRYDWIVETDARRSYPWRVFTLADRVEKLVESDRVYALSSPTRLADSSWVSVGRVPWDWIGDLNLKGVDFIAGKNTDTYLYYIDFAAEHGFAWVCLDGGWLKGLSLDTVNPDIDLARVALRAKEKGVRLIVWADWAELTDGRAEPIFKRYSAMGISGFKIDYFDRDDAEVVRFIEETAALAAKYRLVVDYHGVYKPTGMQRTYPNIVNHEACHGMEQMLWTPVERMKNMARNDVYTAQVRMIAGFLDFTPGAMFNLSEWQYRPSRSLPGSMTTRCHQLAMGVVYEAPMQMYCATPSEYLDNREALDLIKSIPTVWEQTVGVGGELGKWAAVARRGKDFWFVGVLNDQHAREVEIDISFIGAKLANVTMFLDGVNARRNAMDWRKESRTLDLAQPLKIRLASRGGAVIKVED